MKKRIPVLITSFALAACAFSVAAANQNSRKLAKVSATSNEVAISIADGGWNPFGWGSKSVSASGLVDSVTADNEANMWHSDFLNFDKHENIEMELSFSAYDDDEDPIGNNSDGLDIYMKSADNNTVYGIFRIWSKAWGAHNGTHSIRLWGGNWGASAENDADFPASRGGATAVIKGDATSASSFKFRFNKTNGIEFWDVWDDWSHCGVSNVTDPIINGFNSDGGFSLVFGADGGFAKDISITLKAYNGQSFANDGAVFTDNVGPEIVHANGGSVGKYQPVPHTASAWDVFGGDREVSYLDSTDQPAPAYFAETGEVALKAVANDGNTNASEAAMNFTVGSPTASSFAAWLLMDHSETCAEKYHQAKLIFKELSADEKTSFQEGAFSDARDRYEAWCTANHDVAPYDGGDPVASNNVIGVYTKNNTNVAMVAAIIIPSTIILLALVAMFIVRRKKHQ